MSYRIVIPARLSSSRLPGKVLLDLNGRPLIAHVIDAARRAEPEELVVATDDAHIAEVAENAGAIAVMTDPDHPSGSDRVREVADARGWSDDTVVVNVQGDEPLLPPVLIRQVAEAVSTDGRADWATVAAPIDDVDEYLDPNAVKLVTDREGFALYFSRAPIPWDRALTPRPALPGQGLAARRHIGLYAYRAGALRRYCAAPTAALEMTECLEQLRALWLGMRIRVVDAAMAPPAGVDTQADLDRVARLLQSPAAGQ